ncbi:MAG: MBL fold metallo-hydrolase [Acidobacteria bacterium]|nr:MBL fold metallo-hydrolase [Acidobacteriota bacterium]
MLLRFFGTKGYVDATSPSHAGHSAFTIEAAGFRLLCDFGENRRGGLAKIAPDAVFVSHAHPDHAWGLAEGTDVPVLASEATHALLSEFPIAKPVRSVPGVAQTLGPFRLTTFDVVHSLRCPCIAARIETPEGTLVYSGDIVSFENAAARDQALAGADAYVGDGSTLTASLVRRHGSGVLVGHTTIRAQLGWLGKARVPEAVFSHFGEAPIGMGDRDLEIAIEELARKSAPQCRAVAARDGLEVEIPFG